MKKLNQHRNPSAKNITTSILVAVVIVLVLYILYYQPSPELEVEINGAIIDVAEIESECDADLSVVPEYILSQINIERTKQKFAVADYSEAMTYIALEWESYIHNLDARIRIKPPSESYLGSAFVVERKVDSEELIALWIKDMQSNKRLCYPTIRDMGLSATVYENEGICTMVVRKSDINIADRYYWILFPVYYELTSGEIAR